MKKLEEYVKSIPDFPEKGIIFRDVTSVLQDADGLIRKKGKLPRETVSATYDLEYGSATIEMHKDSIKPGQKVLIVDDLIATGGTTEAMIKLIESLGGEVAGVVVLIELAGLKGRERINKYRLESAICYEGK